MIESLSPASQAYLKAVIDAQIIARAPLEAWLRAHLAQGGALYDLAEQLPEAGLVSEFILARDLAQHLKIPYMNDLELELYASAHPALSRQDCASYHVLCVSDGPRDPLPIVTTNPLDQEVLDYISALVGAQLKLHLTTPSELRAELEACYGPEEPPSASHGEGEQRHEVTPQADLTALSPSSEREGSSADLTPHQLKLSVSEAEARAQEGLIKTFKELLAQ